MAGLGVSAVIGIPGLGVPELTIILVIVLLLFGPKRLPQLGKSLGKTVKSIRDGMDGKDEEALEEGDEDLEEETAPKKGKKAAASGDKE